ncbi:MAG: hypothetical protein IMW91_01700 [Firmicutes bacterium]|nr:hypothetical protein [Bacillota bacterium]
MSGKVWLLAQGNTDNASQQPMQGGPMQGPGNTFAGFQNGYPYPYPYPPMMGIPGWGQPYPYPMPQNGSYGMMGMGQMPPSGGQGGQGENPTMQQWLGPLLSGSGNASHGPNGDQTGAAGNQGPQQQFDQGSGTGEQPMPVEAILAYQLRNNLQQLQAAINESKQLVQRIDVLLQQTNSASAGKTPLSKGG